jgi:hypothetical protein
MNSAQFKYQPKPPSPKKIDKFDPNNSQMVQGQQLQLQLNANGPGDGTVEVQMMS